MSLSLGLFNTCSRVLCMFTGTYSVAGGFRTEEEEQFMSCNPKHVYSSVNLIEFSGIYNLVSMVRTDCGGSVG